MNWDRIKGNWKQVTGQAKAQWGKLTDSDLAVVDGRREQLAGKIQERYGVARDEAERQLAEWERKATAAWFNEGGKTVNVPVWAGIVGLVIGGALLLYGTRKGA
jgi:uncharacterized protein YjbJ (UPF0337 family)